MYGYAGQVLRVNLSSGQITKEPLAEETARQFIGGRGLAAKILWDELSAGIDPLGPENKLVAAVGPFADSTIPGGTRHGFFAKSPITGGWGESHGAGSFGPMLKRCGYDAVIIEGRSDAPVYLWITDEGVEIRDAASLWGMNTGETLEAIREATDGRAEVAAIGQAGERLGKLACIMSDYDRAAGRSGLGAVMGSKNLKAIALLGKRPRRLADPDAVRAEVKALTKRLLEWPTSIAFRKHGTPAGIGGHNAAGMYPVRNFQEGYSDEDLIDRVKGETMTATILVKGKGCTGCPVRCHRVVKVEADESPYGAVDPKWGGPEFETIGLWGPNLGIYDLNYIAQASARCNQYGLDTIGTGTTIGIAMEAFQRGIITTADTGGVALKWGDPFVVLELLDQIAFRADFGAVLSEGPLGILKRWPQTAPFNLHVKGHPFPVHMPRGKVAHGLSYATSNRGACHLQGMHDTTVNAGLIAPDIGIDEKFKGLSRMAKEHKAELVYRAQNWRAIEDSFIICKFIGWDYGAATATDCARMLSAVTGWDVTAEDLTRVGERAYNLCRMFNVREGMSRKDDTLPARVGEHLPRGATKDSVITPEDLNRMLDEYYAWRGWDENGIPTPERLSALGLEMTRPSE
jgi:aldehyde:ferredoxin oxidoreductase